MEELSLRDHGPLVQPFGWPMTPAKDPPRALKTLAQIVENDLCHRCGSCIGICPTNVLGLDGEDYPVVKNLSACIDCDLCVKVCPGDDFDAPSIARQMFGELPDIHDMHGHFEEAYLAHATDEQIRQASTSGGLITALLIDLLETGIIDGAVVIAADPAVPWKGKPIIARTREQILGATKSKYAISPTNSVFSEILALEGRYAIVGLPCQIHGFHNAARLDRRLRDRVVVAIGLFCHAAVEHEPFRWLWENHVDKRRGKITRFISRIGKHPGTPHIFFEDGTSQPLYFPQAKGYRPSSMEILNILYRLYTPARCMTCYDSTAEFADIAVGDPWLPPPSDDINFLQGYSFVLARTPRAQELLAAATERKTIALRALPKSIAKTSNVMMGHEKRYRAFRVIETLRRQGRSVPNYHFRTPKASGEHFVKTEIHMLSHIFCYIPRLRPLVLKVVFSKLGYAALSLNYLRREFRYWRKVKLFNLKKRLGYYQDAPPPKRPSAVASSGPAEIPAASQSAPQKTSDLN